MSKGSAATSKRIYAAKRVLPCDLETPVSAFLKIRRLFPDEPSFLFESVERGEQVGRYSILGFHPVEMTRWLAGDGANPLHLLEEGMNEFRARAHPSLMFPFGSFGYLSYEAVHAFEKVGPRKGRLIFPSAFFLVPKRLLLFDHVRNLMTLFVLDTRENCAKGLQDLIGSLGKPLGIPRQRHRGSKAAFSSSETKASYMEKVERAKEHIRRGDIFQVVLSQQLSGKTTAAPVDIYRALRVLNPSPYMFFLDLHDFQMIGSSPEMLVKVSGGIAETRPIAGTRPRGKDDVRDQALAVELLADSKERAEHVMLVDLGRNDLGRICEYGSVRVKSYMEIERYSHVMHLVSVVQGKIGPRKSSFDLLQSSFPAGTVTGAPKVRAMQIIEALETVPRGPYAGCVGYFSFSGDLDTCITIRTIIMRKEKIWLQAGAGIVADSNPGAEYQETLHKMEGMKQAVRMAETGLTEVELS